MVTYEIINKVDNGGLMFASGGKHPRDYRTSTREQNPGPSADGRDNRTVTFVITAHLVSFVSTLAASIELLATAV